MKRSSVSFVITGHVDHGKSTLIGRVLYDTGSVPEELIEDVKAISEELGKEMEFAYLLDALEEERAQNITIDTTQRFLSHSGKDLIIIDAPGHKEFLRNMITGASLADAAVLMVDASLGIEEQTRRHGFILKLLGMNQILVAVNKMDLVEYEESKFQEVKSQIEAFAEEIGVRFEAIIPLSAQTGDNVASKSEKMPWYKGVTLLDELVNLELPEVLLDQPFRFPVQDCYEVDGSNVLVGRVESGKIDKGSSLTVISQGSPQESKLGTIKVWGAELDKASAGQSVGIVLEGDEKLERGAMLIAGGSKELSSALHATVFWMSDSPLKVGSSVDLLCTTQTVKATVKSLKSRIDSSSLEALSVDAGELCDTEVGVIEFDLEHPIVVEDFYEIEELGRFVLSREDDIIGGGILVD